MVAKIWWNAQKKSGRSSTVRGGSFNKDRPATIGLFHSTVMVALLRDRSVAVA
jgi:hypothetical protein